MMGKMTVPTSSKAAVPMASAPVRAPRARQHWLVRRVLSPLASLQLTVVLFALALVLVFCGTLAQVDEGIWTVLHNYFRTGLAWIPLQVFIRFGQVFFGVSKDAVVSGSFPFPGGWLIGGLLLINLLAAHAVRFRLTWKRSGVLILHAGLMVMMLGELVTGLFAVEGKMTIEQRRASNYIEQQNATELAIIDPSDSLIEDVVVIPDRILRKRGRIRHELLPFDVEVVQYMVNSERPGPAAPQIPNPATAGDGLAAIVQQKPEVSGTDPDQPVDIPSAYLVFKKKDTAQSLGTYLVTVWFSGITELGERPQQVAVDGKTYDVYLRFKRIYKPYTIYLKEFRHDVYVGTDIPKNYSSLVRLVDPSRNEDREVLIYMNEPLRYAGETFYQASFLKGDTGTILQVVHNPGWLMPYISCVMVSVGMLIHFGIHLVGFLRMRFVE